ncbi:VOC family protein [Actinoplanes sp. RD1]|uniref:VOC family protein n=1 Tax=Actinoplanes sp. RD1 TaxID=3064538 RepID=UPI002741884C|nr:VOC family protein [Actinoplanes sp. RD1]
MISWISGTIFAPSKDTERFWLHVTRSAEPILRVLPPYADPSPARLDLHVRDAAAGTRRMLELGATVTGEAGGVVLLRSPAGVSFGLTSWHGDPARPVEAGVYRMCLDLPADRYDEDGRFWSTALRREKPVPLGVSLLRVNRPEAGMHLRQCHPDRAAEVRRHVALGATVIGVDDDATTLHDPSGQEYRVADRRKDGRSPSRNETEPQ